MKNRRYFLPLNRLEHLVIDEKLTQAEADEILTWLLSRPEAAAKLNRQLLRGGDGMEWNTGCSI